MVHGMLAGVLAVVSVLPVCELATNSVASRLAAANPTNCLNRFLDYPPSKGKLGFPRCLFQDPFPTNSNFWLKDVDVSCASPWNDESGAQRAGTLISKRHIVFARHYPLWKGVRISFVGMDGGVCPCAVVATKAVDKTDLMIGLLDYEVTPNIRVAKVLPSDARRHLGNGEGLPVVAFDQRERLHLYEMRPMPAEGERSRIIGCRQPKNPLWRPFWNKMVVGDSGNPAFLLLGREVILLYCMWAGYGGPAIHLYRAEIQRAMDELCPGYKLETFDFSKLKL